MTEVYFGDLTREDMMAAILTDMESAIAGTHRGFKAYPEYIMKKWVEWVQDLNDAKQSVTAVAMKQVVWDNGAIKIGEVDEWGTYEIVPTMFPAMWDEEDGTSISIFRMGSLYGKRVYLKDGKSSSYVWDDKYKNWQYCGS
jgi:hypothetical protein